MRYGDKGSQVKTVRIIQGDCVTALKMLPDESVHCCVTSPSYWGLRDYGIEGQFGLEPTPGEYVTKMVGVFREVRRILRSDGTLWLNLGDSYANSGGAVDRHRDSPGGFGKKNTRGTQPSAAAGGGFVRPSSISGHLKPKDLIGIPWRVALALQADGWYLRQDIIWHKPNTKPESVTDRCTKAHEYVFLLTKSATYYYDHEAVKESASGGTSADATRNRRSVWSVPTKSFRGAHFAVMPEALVEPCILAGTSQHGCCPRCGAPWRRAQDWQPTCSCAEATVAPCTVLDPFGGSGTVGVVAIKNGRSAVLCEINADYVEIMQQRLRTSCQNMTVHVSRMMTPADEKKDDA